MGIFLAILALSFLIIIHELGHFTVAKLAGIKVLEFSLFMGPKLFSIQKGETVYSVRLIPLGGFVRMEGEEEASDDERAYNKKPILSRAAVAFAGPLMNLLVALIILTIVFSMVGFWTTVVDDIRTDSAAYKAGIQKGDRIVSFDNKKVYHPMDLGVFMFVTKDKPVNVEIIRDDIKITKQIIPDKIPAQKRYILGFTPKENEGKDSNVVGNVLPESKAGRAGLQVNDRIIALNGKTVASRQEIGDYLKGIQGENVQVTVLRNNTQITLNIEPTIDETPEMYDIGMSYENKKSGLLETIRSAFSYTFATVRSVYYSLVWLITGTVSLNALMGPVGIVTTIGDVVKQSPTVSMVLLSLLNITAFISINLGIMNLIPFPALDGSKLLLLAVEGIRRKAIPPEKEAFISMVGFVLLIMLMIFTTYNDIVRRITGG